MAIIVVGGSNSGVGKTSLVCGLIAALTEYRWTAVKIAGGEQAEPDSPSPAREFESLSPRAAHGLRSSSFRNFWGRSTGVRLEKSQPAASTGPVWEDAVAGEDSDPARYLAAGAARALLVSAADGDLSAALNQLWPRFGRGTNLIFESNSIVHHVRADICLLIHAVAERALPLPERKPSFIAAVRHADAMVAHAHTDKLIPDGLSATAPEREHDPAPPSRPIFHLAALERISPEMLAWLRRKLDPAPDSPAPHF
jgi:hypothetical protein